MNTEPETIETLREELKIERALCEHWRELAMDAITRNVAERFIREGRADEVAREYRRTGGVR